MNNIKNAFKAIKELLTGGSNNYSGNLLKKREILVKRKFIVLIIIFIIAVILYIILSKYPLLTYNLFLYPSAKLSSLFLGTPCISSEEGFILPHRLMDITVLPECSGAYFWLILYTWILFLLFDKHPFKKGILLSFQFLPVSLLTAWFANSMRIVLSFWIYLIIRQFFSEEILNIIHQAAGIALFLPVLMAATYLLKGGILYGKQS